MNEVTQHDVRQWSAEIAQSSKSTANKALNMLSAAITWGVSQQHLPRIANPCQGVARYQNKSRSRFLSIPELDRFRAALAGETPMMRSFFLLSLLTGARRNNVQSMRWDELDLDAGMWHIPMTKNGDEQVIALTPAAVYILRARENVALSSCWVFPTRSTTGHLVEPKRAWKRVLERAEIDNARLHDLRRTLASHLAIKGNSQYVIASALGHRDVRSTAVYARLNLAAVRSALESVHHSWCEPLGLLITDNPIESTESTALQERVFSVPEVPRVRRDSKSENAKNKNVQIGRTIQAVVEGKILQAALRRPLTKKDIYQKLGRHHQVNKCELERILEAMIRRGLLSKHQGDGCLGSWYYSIPSPQDKHE